eukprot:s4710_g10.t1
MEVMQPEGRNCEGPRSPRSPRVTPGLLTSSWQLCRCDPTSSQSRRGAFQQVVDVVLWNTVGPCQSCTCRATPGFPSSRAYLPTTKLHSYSQAAAKCSARRFETGEGETLTQWMDIQPSP